MKRILVSTDLSPESRSAFPVAKQMAAAFGAKLGLLLIGHEMVAIPSSFGLEAPVYLDSEVQTQLNDKLKADLEKLRQSEFPGMDVDLVFKTGSLSPVDGILDAAAEEKADCLIMSSHGRSGVRRVLLGSVTERVSRESPCPVMIVPVPHAEKK